VTAILSPDERYRYRLVREDLGLLGTGTLLWIMLNPSTADAHADDPTIRRVRSFTEREGFGRLEVVNLFALRATNPDALREAEERDEDPVGPENRRHIAEAIAEADRVVAAWGALAPGTRAAEVRLQAANLKRGLWCLGETSDGSPRHPLYVKGDQPLVPFLLG
jgi:hypothetical protein